MPSANRVLGGKPTPAPPPPDANGQVLDPDAPLDPSEYWTITVKGSGSGRDTHITCIDPRRLPNGERRQMGRAQLILLRLNDGVVPGPDEEWAVDHTDRFIRRLLVKWDACYPDTHPDKALRGRVIPLEQPDDPTYNPLDHLEGRVWDELAAQVMLRMGPPKRP
jgi:hypothetical protein